MRFGIAVLLAFCFSIGIAIAKTGSTYDSQNIYTLDKNKVEFNGVGVGAVVPASTTDSIIDYVLTDDMFMTGAKMAATGACGDDRIKVQVVMGTTVVKQFIDWWSLDMDTQLPIPSKVPAIHPTLAPTIGNVKIRALYTNTCTVPVKVRINYHLYKIIE